MLVITCKDVHLYQIMGLKLGGGEGGRKSYKCHADTLLLFYLKYLEYLEYVHMQIKYLFHRLS